MVGWPRLGPLHRPRLAQRRPAVASLAQVDTLNSTDTQESKARLRTASGESQSSGYGRANDMAERDFTISNRHCAFLRIDGRGDVPVSEIEEYLEALQNSYGGLTAFESLTDSAIERIQPFLPSVVNTEPSTNIRVFPIAPIWTDMVSRFSSPRFKPVELIRPDQVLMLKAVRMESPGFWEFFGKLNPLEVIRQFLNDMHEHRKDREYREAAEERRLNLKNLALENQIIKARISLAKSLGATDADLTPLLNQLVVGPLNQLARYQVSA